jgi:hypothetical protein
MEGAAGKGEGGEKGREMTQTLYANMNKRNFKKGHSRPFLKPHSHLTLNSQLLCI